MAGGRQVRKYLRYRKELSSLWSCAEFAMYFTVLTASSHLVIRSGAWMDRL